MTPDSLESGLRHHQSGNLDQAEQVYRRILRIDPRHPDALHLLGVVGHQRGESRTAVALIGQAIAVNGTNPLYHSNLGAAHQALGHSDDAVRSFRRAVELNPRYADAHFNLGVALEGLGQREGAESAFEQTLRLKPDHAEAHNNLGNLLKARGRLDEAAAHYRQALSTRPQLTIARFNLGTVLQLQGLLDAAADCYREAIVARPDYAEAHDNLGLIHATRGEYQAAFQSHQAAVWLRPDWPPTWLHLGSACTALGRLEEAHQALSRCEALLTAQTAATLSENLLLALIELSRAEVRGGSPANAVETLRQAQRLDPESADVWFELGTACQLSDDIAAAIAAFEKSLALQPENAAAHNNLAILLDQQDRQSEALAHCERAILLQPEFAEAFYNLGNLRRDEGHTDEAIRCYREALRIQPSFAAAHNNLGNVLQSAQDLEGAADCYRAAIVHRPHSAATHTNLGNVLQSLGRLDEAQACYAEALRIDPGSAEPHNSLGTVLAVREQIEEACGHFRSALSVEPDHVDALTNLGSLLKSQGLVEEARECLERALSLRPSSKLRVLMATLLPAVYESAEGLRAWRTRLTEQVATLVRDGVTLDAGRETLPNCFYLAYQGLNDVELQRQMARLYPIVDCRSLEQPKAGRIRIGFLSRHFRTHTIGRLMHGLMAGLNRDEFEVVVLSLSAPPVRVAGAGAGCEAPEERSSTAPSQPDARPGPPVGPAPATLGVDPLAQRIQADADRFVPLPASLSAARQAIAAERLDVLVFADLGMEPLTYSLAFTRFAPVQCVTWGHPVTTGSPAIDYFLSSDLVEPSEAQNHYSERLVRLKGLPAVYARPALPDPLRPRSEFGLTEDANLYLCPQSLFKLHPDFDAVLGQILERDPDGRAVLLEGAWPHWTAAIRRRLERTIPTVVDRVLFAPQQSHAGFLNLLAVCDVMLDPLHFGGGNSTYEAMAVGIPIVTRPGEFLRGRVTAGCYRRMGFTDCIADSIEHYIDLAVRLGTDRSFNRETRERIAASRMVLFNDTSVLRELEEFFKEALRSQGRMIELCGTGSASVEPPVPAAEERPEANESEPVASAIAASGAERVGLENPTYWRPALHDVLQTHTCPACGHHVCVPFYDGGDLPLTTLAWPKSRDEARAMARLPHEFVRCVDCGHVYNCRFDYANVPYSDKPNLMFNRGILWIEHLRKVRDLILARVGPRPTVVEVGCGDGHLLRALATERPAGRYVGFDPSGAIDDGGGLIVARRELFLPERHLAELKPDLIVSRHVLEHLMNPLGFVQALAFACSWEDAETQLLIEVPCIDQVFAAGRTVDFFYEHNSHFTTNSLRKLLLRCASEVELIERSYNDEVVYGLARFRRRAEHAEFSAQALQFRRRVEQSKSVLRQDLDRLAASGKRVAIWGGTGKAAAFINQHGLDGDRFPLVVDSDADKAGTFVPGTGQEIRHRDWLLDHPVDTILIATQWRAGDIVLEIERRGLTVAEILLEHQGRLVNFHQDPHPYRTAA